MKSFLASKFDRRKGAFTLVEMLVSIAVLALFVVLVSRLTTSAASTIAFSGKHMDADKAARLVFDRMTIDFARMLKRNDIDYSFQKQNGNDSLAFFCETVGFYGRTNNPPSYSRRSPLSLVGYRAIQSTNSAGQVVMRFDRLSAGLGWEPGGSNQDAYSGIVFHPMTIVPDGSGNPSLYPGNNDLYFPGANSAIDFKTISEQVFRFEYCFLLKDGTLSVNPWIAPHTAATFSDIAAIVAVIGVLDNTSRVVAGDLQKLADAFPDAVSGEDIQAKWTMILESSSFPPAGVTKSAALLTRIYQRHFYLPN
jgi:prepilin-type N-terminal cleavage/methylation domain-containing protein